MAKDERHGPVRDLTAHIYCIFVVNSLKEYHAFPFFHNEYRNSGARGLDHCLSFQLTIKVQPVNSQIFNNARCLDFSKIPVVSMTNSLMPYDKLTNRWCQYQQCQLCIYWPFYCILHVQGHLWSACVHVRANHWTPAVSIGSDPWVGPWRACVFASVWERVFSAQQMFFVYLSISSGREAAKMCEVQLRWIVILQPLAVTVSQVWLK